MDDSCWGIVLADLRMGSRIRQYKFSNLFGKGKLSIGIYIHFEYTVTKRFFDFGFFGTRTAVENQIKRVMTCIMC